MEALRIKDVRALSALLGYHEMTAGLFLNQRRIPSEPVFNKLVEVLGVEKEALLSPLVEVGNG